ncbi:MAG TPA: hypothetical protein VK453_24045 [Micromonosporaceae bacterium]|nr:hypothetical protein [Micromonosporaceae bacterium]
MSGDQSLADAGPGPASAPTPTGHPAVDTALAGLAQVARLDPREQVEWYAEVHRTLHQTLQEIDAN